MYAALLLVATMMAIFGVIGYLKGAKWALIAFAILLLAFIATLVAPDTIVSTFNGLYLGVMLTLKGGLGAIASGDVDAAKATIESVNKPFDEGSEDLALLLVILGAVGVGLILAALMKRRPGVGGLFIGLAYGYVLTAAVLPLISDNPAAALPIPILRPSGAVTTGEASNALSQIFTTLGQPQNIQLFTILIAVFIIALVFLTARRGIKKKG